MSAEPIWFKEFEKQTNSVRPIMLAIATRHAGAEDAEDVVQTALMLTWRQAPKLTGERCFARWATFVTRRVAIDYYRKRVRRAETGLPKTEDILQPLHTTRATDAETAVIERIDEEKARLALAALPAKGAQVLLERDGLDMDYDDMLARHGLTFTQLKNLLYRMRVRFREEYHRLGVGIATAFGFGVTPKATTATAGAHARAAAASFSIGRFATTSVLILAVGTGATVVLTAKPSEAPPDQIPIAAIVSTSEPSTTAPTPTVSAASAAPLRSPSPVASPKATVTPSPTSTAPISSAPRAVAKVGRPPVTPPPAPRSVAPASSNPPAAAATSTAATPPRLGYPEINTVGVNPAAHTGGVDITPSCQVQTGNAISIRWTIINQLDVAASVGPHNGTGSPTTIPPHTSGFWQQTLPRQDAASWWFSLIDTSGTQVGHAEFSAGLLATYPSC